MGGTLFEKRAIATCVALLIDAEADADVINAKGRNEDDGGVVSELVRSGEERGLIA